MSESYKKIEVTCPTCGLIKNINIPEAIFSQKKFKTIKVQVPVGAVCQDHQFIVFIDTKGIIRGYEKIDLMMVRPEDLKKAEMDQKLNLKKLISILGTYGTFCLLHTKIFNYPSYVFKTKNLEKLADDLNEFFNNFFPDTYSINPINFIDEMDFNKLKSKEKDALILDSYMNFLQIPWKEKLNFEESIIQKAIDIIDENEQLILLKQEISKLIKEAEYISTLLQPVNEISREDLIDQLSKDMQIPKINNARFNLIKELIERRMSPELTKKIKSIIINIFFHSIFPR